MAEESTVPIVFNIFAVESVVKAAAQAAVEEEPAADDIISSYQTFK